VEHADAQRLQADEQGDEPGGRPAHPQDDPQTP
jgi:hypothetical protein